jgi:putative ATP-dependent endonuclease of OLD family
MLITTVEIENFRCIESHSIEFDKITSFIGPNGAGKSTVLRALDWVFNSAKDALTITDFFGSPKATTGTISVTVHFSHLTSRDRSILTHRYAPPHADTFALKREWSVAGGDRLSGASAGYPAFAPIRKILDGPADPVKALFAEVRGQLAEAGVTLASAASKPAIGRVLDEWEATHPDTLLPTFSSDSQMFGFAGQGELAKVFSYVFVDADLRANVETEDSGKTILGKLLFRALDRSEAETALADLADEVTQKHDAINKKHLGPSLAKISRELTAGIGRFTAGRQLVLRPQGSLYTPPKARVDVRVLDHIVETALANQGHGFQRAALVASLQVLADYSTDSTQESVLFLAIEEPELFQHPTQARAFASVLRRLARDTEHNLQIAYATHSPYFVDPFEFHEVRRVTRTSQGKFSVAAASREVIATLVSTQMSDTWDISSGWSKLILLDLREALFASAVVLCEGADDAAVLQGASAHFGDFDVFGITATAVRGKTDLFLAQAVLAAFDIPTLVVWDNDSRVDERAIERKLQKLIDAGQPRALTPPELAEIANAKGRDAAHFNRKLVAFMNIDLDEDYPIGLISENLFAVDDTLETMLAKDWPAFLTSKRAVIASGEGVDSAKHEATYRLAAQQCTSTPTGALAAILASAEALAVA